MLRRDVGEAVVGRRLAHAVRGRRIAIFVLERADTMNDEAANALLKTLEEPPSYVVLLLLTDRPTQVLPTIASRCQAVRFDPPVDRRSSRSGSSARASRRTPREAAARLSLGDGEKALALAIGDGLSCGSAAENLARAPLHGTGGRAAVARRARPRQAARAGHAKSEVEQQLKEELQYLPKKEHKRRETEFTERARRADRRADHAGARPRAPARGPLVPRPRASWPTNAPELVFHSDRTRARSRRTPAAKPQACSRPRSSSTTPAPRLILNVSEELACEALAYRLEEALSSSSSSA